MEYVPYGNLLQRINKRKKLKESDVVKFAKEMVEILEFLHSNFILHRDLKLENILMVSKINDFEFKLADFGLACYLDKETNTRSGSPGYLAPELFQRAGRCTPKADMFSFGIIVYTLLTGVSPFRGNSRNAILDKNIKCIIDYKPSLFKEISNEAKGFLKDLLNSHPNERLNAEDAAQSK